MEFSKKYPLPGKGDQYVLLTWERGYTNVKVYYGGKVIDKIENPGTIKRGYAKQIEDFGLLELSFNEKPMYIRVSIDGLLCPLKKGDEAKELTPVATYFYILFGLSVIGTLMEGAQFGFSTTAGIITTAINVFFTAIYLVAAIFSAKGKTWAYYMGTIAFSFTTLLLLVFNLMAGNVLIIVNMVVRAFILYALFKYFKTARMLDGINKKQGDFAPDLLDV